MQFPVGQEQRIIQSISGALFHVRVMSEYETLCVFQAGSTAGLVNNSKKSVGK